MEESDIAKQRGEKRVREEEEGEETKGGGEKEKEDECQPAAKRPRVESKESGPASGREQATSSEQQPSYAVDSRSEESMTLL
jgi:hypothetical protein